MEDNNDDDLYIIINTSINKTYRVRILCKSKTDEEIQEIIKNDKSKLIYIKK